MISKKLIVGITVKALLLLATFSLFFSCETIEKSTELEPKGNYVVIVSLDGFRHDYPDRFNTPVLDSISKLGVKSQWLLPAFPSSTFPNHYSIATGLHPDNHGIVTNNFYCSELDLSYSIRNRDAVMNGDFYGGEPIWVSAENQNIKTATFFWVGSEAPIQGVQPTYWKSYDHQITYEYRVDKAVKWLSLPEEERPRLVMLYFDEPDSQGHKLGPEGDEIGETIEYLDSLMGALITGLKSLPIYDEINIIITSDHGMGEVSPDRHVNLFDHINRDWVERFSGGNPVFTIKAADGYKDSIYLNLKKVENISIWKNEDIPERLHFGSNPRTLDMTITADSAWSIGFREFNEYFVGTHGYDNQNRDMHTIFYAKGPDFAAGHEHHKFMVIDIHPLLAYLLRVDTPEVDGKFKNIKSMLK